MLVAQMISWKANVNAEDVSLRTPLTWAQLNRQEAVIELLLAAGAVPSNNEIYTDSEYASNSLNSAYPDLQDYAQDETNTVVSFASLPEGEKLGYQLVFTSKLLKAIGLESADARLLDDVTRSLPDLLKKFALKLGHGAKQDKDYDAMFFVLKYGTEIIETFRDRWQETEQATIKAQSSKMSLEERMNLWQDSGTYDPVTEPVVEAEDPPLTESVSIPLTTSQKLDIDDTWETSRAYDAPSVNLDFVITTSAYAWLASQLTQLKNLSFPSSNTVRRAVESCYPIPYKISRATPHVEHTMTFNLEWNLVHFLQSYHFGGFQDTATIMQTFVTLTSDGSHVQALTVLQYLRQTWPGTGELVLTFIIAIVQRGQAKTSFSEGTAEGRLLDSNISIRVIGTSFLIADVAEQLAWLGAAIRPSPKEGLVYDCTASINVMTKLAAETYSCIIRFKDTPTQQDTSATCWHGLFKYAVVAQGFPIAKRAKSISGLEMTLGMMLAFCHARHIGKFNDNITIKGFSSIFSLSEHGSDGCLWHLDRTADSSYISYGGTGKGSQNRDMSVHEILQDRHFVGWCSQSVYGAGAINSTYQIRRSYLRFAHPGCYLYEKSLRRGHNYPPEIICIATNKKFPSPTAIQNFHDRMHQIHNHPVVLWDTDNRRGWLTNGTSALLHLVFASMEKGDSPFTSGYCLRKEDLTQNKHNAEYAAAHILLKEENLNMTIRSHLNEPVRLRDRIEDIYFLLNLMMEEQITAFKDRDTTPTAFEGWDFVDLTNLATKVLQPRVFDLDKDCRGWMTLLKDINAVTLFGNDFGEIYRPVSSTLCAHWSTLPSDNCYLAAYGDDLKMITQEYSGNDKDIPRRLTQNTTWPILRRTFEDCNCSFVVQQHSDLVQVLVPNSIFMARPDMETILCEIPSKGVVIFGESQDSAWLHPDYAEPQRPHLKRLREKSSSEETRDSGLGDSISSVPTANYLESPNYTEYLVAIVCALHKELLAVRCLFDQKYAKPVFDKHDKGSYVFGRISSHKVVAACLPARYGGCLATNVATELRRSFPMVKICLLVGIAGGIPSPENDIRLGDVVVSYPSKNHSGIVKYDFEKVRQNNDPEPLGSFKPPPEEFLHAISILRSDPEVKDGSLQQYIESIVNQNQEYLHPEGENDTLYMADHSHHPKAPACVDCSSHIVQRLPRRSIQPRIHYGLIASGDKVVKDAKLRDDIGRQHEALCVEMEAAGVASIFESLVIRGICDYADSHKNERWQNYASAAAAAYAKLLLEEIRPLPSS